MVVFLYHRLYQTARNQLDALQNHDFRGLDRYTCEREEVTRDLCQRLAEYEPAAVPERRSDSERRRIHDLTTQTLDIDCDIKQLLLAELRGRSLELEAVAAGPRPDNPADPTDPGNSAE